MIAIGNEREGDIIFRQRFDKTAGMLPRDVRVFTSLQDGDRAACGEGLVQQKVIAAILDQLAGDGVGSVSIGGGTLDPSIAHQPLPALFIQPHFPNEFLGEVRGGGDEDKSANAARSPGGQRSLAMLLRQPQRQPAAHGRADEDLRAVGNTLKHGKCFFQPARDGAVFEGAARQAVAGVIHPGHGLSARPCVSCQCFCLGAIHVGLEAGEPEQAWLSARFCLHRDLPFIRAVAEGEELKAVLIQCKAPL